MVDKPLRLLGNEIADQRQRGVVGAVPGGEKLADVVERGRAEVFHRADRGPVVGVVRIVSEIEQPLERRAVRNVVVTLAAFFLDHLALDVELLLRQRRKEIAHAIRFEPEAEGEVV